MKLTIITTLIFAISTSTLHAQDTCSTFYPMNEGATMEYTNYDKKGKIEGVSTFKVTETKTMRGITYAEMSISYRDKKGKEVYNTQYNLSCSGDLVSIDYESLLPSEMMKQYGEMDIEISGNDIEIPNNLQVGQQLKDSNVLMNINMGGMTMKIAIDMTNRHVEKKEKITTSAGTFDCYVLYSDTKAKMMMANQTYPSRVWVAEGVGMVKQETYKKNGTLDLSTQLTAFSN